MAVGTPIFLLGRNITVSITPQDVAADGSFTNNALGTLTFTGLVEDDSLDLSLSTQNFSSVRSFNSNPVPTEIDGTYTITELMKASPLPVSSTYAWNTANYLEKCSSVSLYHKIVISALSTPVSGTGYTGLGTTGTTVRTWTFYGLMTSIRRTSPKGKNLCQATFKLVSVGDGAGGFLPNPSLGP